MDSRDREWDRGFIWNDHDGGHSDKEIRLINEVVEEDILFYVRHCHSCIVSKEFLEWDCLIWA